MIKNAAPVIAHYSGISRALAFRYAGAGIIFGLHGICHNDASDPDEFLRCPERVLEQTLSWVRRNGIEIVGIDDAIDRLTRLSARRFCVFTFDDGYLDNLTRALPIMESYQAPFTVYVATGMLTGELDAWWLGLAALIRNVDHLELPELDCRIWCGDLASKQKAFVTIRALIDTKEDGLGAVTKAIAAHGIDSRALARAEGLNVAQLRQLAASPLVTIGAHGVRHIKLAGASTADVELEMAGSRRTLEQAIGREVKHFAYPFGSCGQREVEIARSVGFRTSVTTERGTLFAEHLNHLQALPRETIWRRDTRSSLRCKVDGTYRAFRSRLGSPIAHL
jgi:peptidoglycan/xylan/chitin deacetylase (PgdA/CDA1 family)